VESWRIRPGRERIEGRWITVLWVGDLPFAWAVAVGRVVLFLVVVVVVAFVVRI
jgi:hypothetical protein